MGLAVLAVMAVVPVLAAQEPAAAAPSSAPKPQTLGLFVYPGIGQDAAQQGKAEDDCYGWGPAQKKAGKQAEAQAQQTAATRDTQNKDTFKKAWGACLEGRGYNVK